MHLQISDLERVLIRRFHWSVGARCSRVPNSIANGLTRAGLQVCLDLKFLHRVCEQVTFFMGLEN